MIPPEHSRKVAGPDDIFTRVKMGDNIFISSGCAEPQHLIREFLRQSGKLWGTSVINSFSLGAVSGCAEVEGDKIRLNSLFAGRASRSAIACGVADYTPITLSEVSRMIRERTLKIDGALIHVSPPDEKGLCSYGISVEIVKPAAEAADYVIAQVNPRMPRTCGDSLIHVDDIDVLVPHEEPVLEWHLLPPDETARKIGRNVARVIEDGSTIQVGVGRIHDAMLACLRDKKRLGVHTEMFSDGIIDLVEGGVITNEDKSLHPGRVVASFCMGTRRLYDYVDRNPLFEFYPCEYVGDQGTISRNDRMVSINSATQIDLTGQVCADSVGRQIISGIGSQPDFVRGARHSRGGKSVIALPSTAKDDTVSRITVELLPGAGVVTTRGDIQYVATEYGVVNLEGKSIRERALALIEIAHPKFRQRLLAEAKQAKFIFDDQTIPPVERDGDRESWEERCALADGTGLRLRPIRPSDERALQRFKYSLSDEDVFLRFMTAGTRFTHARIMPLTTIDYTGHMAVVAVTGNPGSEEIVGVARYYNDPATNIAEVAFTVLERWRLKGIGTRLLAHITTIARHHGIAGFRAEILGKNRAMMNLFHTSARTMHSRYEDDLYTLWYTFDEPTG